VARVRANYPRARLLLLNSPTLPAAKNQRLDEYLQRVITNRAAVGDSALAHFSFRGHYASGCDGHPNLAEHIRMAEELEPRVRAEMHW
jgi:hypothetical protein